MTENIKFIKDSKVARWTALILVSLTMFAGYYFADVLSPLKTMILENGKLNWSNTGYGMYTSAYSWFNVFFGMLIIGGIILDKSGIRFTGLSFSLLMVVGGLLNYYALTDTFLNGGFGYDFLNSFMTNFSPSLKLASFGFALFGVGIEIIGVTASRTIVKWFKGKEMATAMALQVAIARMGMLLVFYSSPRLASDAHIITRPVAFGILLMIIGFATFLVYNFLDTKFDREAAKLKLQSDKAGEEEEQFKFSDLGRLFTNKSFIYIALLCVLFYSAVFPFMKYASDLMVNKFGVLAKTAGDIPSLLPLGTMILTPVFGLFLDYKGKSASIMILGSILLIFVHLVFAYGPASQPLAIVLMLILGIAFSLVPAAMWPSVPKIVDERYLGTAYSTIFWIQNWGLWGMPLFIGWILDKVNPGVTAQIREGVQGAHYNYTIPMLAFAATGVFGLFFAILLKREDKVSGFGLELPNKQD
ncbi:MAG: MFS transporter [Bacteroidetes bacterium]|nr:MAG: MFS transporter [Bacteroidota bacterium]